METLKDFRFRALITSPPSESALEAAKKMEDNHVGCVVIISGGKVLGIATRYDFLHHLIVKGKKPESTTITEIMHVGRPATREISKTAHPLLAVLNGRMQNTVNNGNVM